MDTTSPKLSLYQVLRFKRMPGFKKLSEGCHVLLAIQVAHVDSLRLGLLRLGLLISNRALLGGD